MIKTFSSKTISLKAAFFYSILFLLLFIGVSTLIAEFFDLPFSFSDILQKFSFSDVIVILSLSLTNYFLRAYRWHFYTKKIASDIPLWKNILYYCSGFAFTVTPGKIGELIRLYFLKKHHTVSYKASTGLFLQDRLTDISGILILIILSSLWTMQHFVIMSVSVLLLIPLSGLFLYPHFVRSFLHLFYKKSRLCRKICDLIKYLTPFTRKRDFIVASMLAMVGWGCESFGLLIIADCLGFGIDFASACFIFCFSMIAGAFMMTPGGLGGTEGTMIFFLTQNAISSSGAFLITTLSRITTLWFAVFLGLCVTPVLLLKGNKNGGH